MKKIFFVVALVAFTLTSCEKNEVTKQKEVNIYNTTEIPNGMMSFGKKLENPYSVSNMKKAFSSLSQNRVASNIVANHLYIRFLPDNAEEMNVLTSDTILKLYDYPFDYEIKEDGQFYHDPSIPLDKITWQYTVVPADYKFPNVKYEILDQLYLPTEDEQPAEYQALKITNNLPTGVQKSKSASQYTPTGKVLLHDNTTNTESGLRNIKVRLRSSWFKIDDIVTDGNGNFTGEKNFTGKVDVTIIFTNNHYSMRSTLVNLFDNIDYKIGNEVKSCNVVITRTDRSGSAPSGYTWIKNNELWAQSTIANAVEQYYDYCTIENIGTPPNLRIWANRNKKESYGGSAPMFTHGLKYYTFKWDKWWSYAANILYIPVSNVLMNVFQWFLPDVIINYNINSLENSNEICETVFHELAHASHFKKVGPVFWDNYINYIVTYGSYGDGKGVDAGLCAMSESWGFHMGWYLDRKKYGSSVIVTESINEKYKPMQTGNSDNDIHRVVDGTTKTFLYHEGWVPAGILLDLMDSKSDYIRGSYPDYFYDDAEGFSNQDFFNALDKDVRSPQQFRDRLMKNTSDRDKTDVTKLFEAYYYN